MGEQAPAWLHRDRLQRVWGLAGDALERRALETRGSLDLHDLTRDERHALSDVLGRPIAGELVRLRLGELDERLHARTGRGLADVITWVTGRRLVDRAVRRRAAAARREEPFEQARAWLATRVMGPSPCVAVAAEQGPGPDVGGGGLGWVEVWLDGLRRDGVLTGLADGGALLVTALQVLDDRGAFAGHSPQGIVSRTELAARHTGTAHGLDDGTKAALLVLRGAAAKGGTGLPRSATDRRRLWESLGIVVDRVSTTCLTWNLTEVSRTDSAPGPRHVTWWDLDAGLDWAAGQHVLVCENPRTLEAIAESGTPSLGTHQLGVVCTMGRANLVVTEVLGRLVRAGAVLRYHGDFDWPGIALANSCAEGFGARPWLMSADDYLTSPGTHRLVGPAVDPVWDLELGAAMRSRGVAVHEESVLATVLDRLPEIMA